MKLYSDTIRRLIARYKWNSLFFKYIKKLFLIIFIPIIILNGIIYILYQQSAVSTAKNGIKNDYNTVESSVSLALNESVKIIEAVKMDTYFQQFLYANGKLEHGEYYTQNMIDNSTMLINELLTISNYVDSIRVCNYNVEYVVSTKGNNYYSDMAGREVFDSLRHVNYPSYFCVAADNSKMLNVIKLIYDGKNVQSAILVTLNRNAVDGILKNDSLKNIVLANNSGVLFTKDANENCEKIIDDSSYSSQKISFGMLKADRTNLTSELEFANLHLYVSFENSEFKNAFFAIILFMAACFLLAIFITVIIAIFLSLEYYKAITNIVTKLQNEVEGQDESTAKDELTYIISRISGMTQKIENMENDLTQRVVALKKAQITALQGQVNPHFVFNTLNSINLCIMDKLGGVFEPSVMISNLSCILSETMVTSRYLTTIEKEIDYAKKYLEIECIRHMNGFDVEWDIDEDILKCQTVKLILQPIIENSLNHGILKKKFKNGERGIIKISAGSDGTDIVFNISDNGNGFSQQAIVDVKRNISECTIIGSRHIGIANINLRINIIYGEAYGVSVGNASAGGYVTIKIPRLEYEGEEI